MSRGVVTVTGGNGFVGRSVVAGLRGQGYEVRVFDRLRHPLAAPLRRRFLGTSGSPAMLRAAGAIRKAQGRVEAALWKRGVVRPSTDDILDVRSRLAARFAGSDAVIHLAAIPHPFAPGVIDEDFRRINYEGSINVFEAARDAGVPKFVFASSAQVYRIHDPVRIDRFPIREDNHQPTLDEGQTMYGYLKAEFERYLERACPDGSTQGIALRLEFPGVRATEPANFYVCTSLENLAAGVRCAVEAPDTFAFEAFNLADAERDPAVGDLAETIAARFPNVPNEITGNGSAMSVAKAASVLGYAPEPPERGTYYDVSVMW